MHVGRLKIGKDLNAASATCVILGFRLLLSVSPRSFGQATGPDAGGTTNVVELEVPGTAFVEVLQPDLLIRGHIVLPEPAQPVSAEWSSSTGDGGPVTYGADNRFELSVANLPRGKSAITIRVTANKEQVYEGLVIGLQGDFSAPVVTVDARAWLRPVCRTVSVSPWRTRAERHPCG